MLLSPGINAAWQRLTQSQALAVNVSYRDSGASSVVLVKNVVLAVYPGFTSSLAVRKVMNP